MTDELGMKDLIFSEERIIRGEQQYRLINWLNKEEVDRIMWALEYEKVSIVKNKEEKKEIVR